MFSLSHIELAKALQADRLREARQLTRRRFVSEESTRPSPPSDNPVMDGRSAVYVLERLEALGIAVWVDGGWGIDALVGRQTRSHADLDLVIARPDCVVVQAALEPLGLIHDTWVEPGLPARVVLRTERGHQVDLHQPN